MAERHSSTPPATNGAVHHEHPDRQAEPVDLEQPPRLPFAVVGIGASAGGLEAFIQFFRTMRPDSGMAFVLVQHLSPDRESAVAEILARETAMPVREVTDGLHVQPNHVYVIRPAHTLTIREGVLHLSEPLEKRGHQRPVDDFFRSLAEEQRERAIAVVLSGMGSNGTAGAQVVKAVGGVCIAQDPDSAKFGSMPRAVDRPRHEIPAPLLPQIFDRFVQAEEASTHTRDGLGLGLAIVKQIVELHGGICAESDGPGQGSTFVVRLPLPPAEKHPEAAAGAPKCQITDQLSGCNILVVEDVATTRRALVAVLQQAGAHVTAADSAPAAWEAFERQPPDLFVSDLGLPAIDGYTLMREIRDVEGRLGCRPVPALALTAFSGEAISRKALASGFQICLTKPIDPVKLVTTLASMLPAWERSGSR